MEGSDVWQPLGELEPLSHEYLRTHRQLRAGDTALDRRRARRGLSPQKLDDLTESQPTPPFAEFCDQLDGLTRIAEALGGHVEVRAVFDDETITLLREPPPDEPQ